ncbi:MAG TPA: group I intron-associated PD-(D/E)XK endonuclease [Terriglobales bacterium]|nr:group I intron-associated PD-(D/E)XK endonuclease [Terriglobales bacterium]
MRSLIKQSFITQKSVTSRKSVFQQPGILPWLHAVAEELPPDHNRRNTQRNGDIAEASFVVKAESLNFRVAKPWSKDNRYDFILDSGKRLHRMQLKCTASINYRAYQIKPLCTIKRKTAREYTPEDIDFLVAYIIPSNIWYVIPIAAIKGKKCLRFYPDIVCRNPRWEIYREAWHLLRDHELSNSLI